MKLESPDGRFFSLSVEGYEFSDEELGPIKDNPADEFESGRFLIVSHTFRNQNGEWRVSGPTMTTDELGELAEWLESLHGDGKQNVGCYFTEREIEFTFNPRSNKLTVHVFHDFLPDWIGTDQTARIEFSLDEVDLVAAIKSIRQQLLAFPGRPPLQQRGRSM